MRYQSNADRLAPDTARGTFREVVQRAAGVALEVAGLSPARRQLLHDLRRNEGRYPFRALDDLLDTLTLVPDERQALAFCEELRAAILARRTRNAARSLRSALLDETIAEAEANPSQMRLVAGDNMSAAELAVAIDASERQRSTLDRLLDAMRVERFALLHGGAR